ncbi:MAG: HAD family hydrolase [Alphaproteobacteria bacterium]
MAQILPGPGAFRAVVFDLDEALLSRGGAWRYAIEEAVIAVSGRRLSAEPLASEYRNRPWRHALSVLIQDQAELGRCESLCAEMFGRSALKRLTVHEGLGMALDHLRGARIEVGAVTREPHALAIKQIQSTGLDRFLTVLSATPAGEEYDLGARFQECLRFLERPAPDCAFVGADPHDLRHAAGLGASCFFAAWSDPGADPPGFALLERPADLAALVTARNRR